tara:strand:- start:6197 stop:6937 length:741 start_codon:yes stop_codon:yes gene_type:complete
MQSIYAYSNLSTHTDIIINPNGSSHDARDSKERKKHFTFDHLLSEHSDIIISPVKGHELDYFVNQFVKADQGNIQQFLKNIFPDKHWNDEEDWAIREWISFWISDLLATGYKYNTNSDITTDSLFDDNEDVFPHAIIGCIKKLGLSVNDDVNTIKTNHAVWKKQQQYHNLQKRCDKWIDDIVTTGKNITSPCLTIVDEAYVQNCLRSLGYEIRCFKLNNFPKTSDELRLLLYKEMQDDKATKSKDC